MKSYEFWKTSNAYYNFLQDCYDYVAQFGYKSIVFAMNDGFLFSQFLSEQE